jgi:hypothetical protein
VSLYSIIAYPICSLSLEKVIQRITELGMNLTFLDRIESVKHFEYLFLVIGTWNVFIPPLSIRRRLTIMAFQNGRGYSGAQCVVINRILLISDLFFKIFIP